MQDSSGKSAKAKPKPVEKNLKSQPQPAKVPKKPPAAKAAPTKERKKQEPTIYGQAKRDFAATLLAL